LTKIIYTGAFRFPEGDAAAARVLGIGKALRAAGHEVVFAGWEEREREQDRQSDGRFIYHGFSYESQADLRHQQVSPIRRLIRYVFAGGNTLKWLHSKYLNDITAIIAYHGGSLFLLRLATFCRLRRIKLIVDCTEWYDPSHLVGGRFGLVRLDDEIRIRLINSWIDWLLPISSYLESYYSTKGCRVLRVPPLVDLTDSKWLISDNIVSSSQIRLRLAYAGTPGKKDLLGNALRGLSILKGEGVPVELHLIGPSLEDVVTCLGTDSAILDELGDAIIFHGRIPQSDVPRMLATCDFSVLLRPLERYAQAGFPTKLVESLAAGVPVITNPTSDIAEFVRDGIEGILLTDHSPAAFVAGVKRALTLSLAKKDAMRRNARLRAEASFDFRVFVEKLRSFIQECTS
jgi:glycosyltransferase involved in cell wall biosynthesis